MQTMLNTPWFISQSRELARFFLKLWRTVFVLMLPMDMAWETSLWVCFTGCSNSLELLRNLIRKCFHMYESMQTWVYVHCLCTHASVLEVYMCLCMIAYYLIWGNSSLITWHKKNHQNRLFTIKIMPVESGRCMCFALLLFLKSLYWIA